jgi:hypothetical protein
MARILVDTLLEQKAEGNQTDNTSWTGKAWTACADALVGTEAGDNGSGGPPKTPKMCLTRWGTVSVFCFVSSHFLMVEQEKSNYIMVKGLRKKSGWSWDDVGHVIVVDDDIWKEYIKMCVI